MTKYSMAWMWMERAKTNKETEFTLWSGQANTMAWVVPHQVSYSSIYTQPCSMHIPDCNRNRSSRVRGAYCKQQASTYQALQHRRHAGCHTALGHTVIIHNMLTQHKGVSDSVFITASVFPKKMDSMWCSALWALDDPRGKKVVKGA